MEAVGVNGRMIFADNKITISRKGTGLITLMYQGMQGDKVIPIQQITAVQLREAGFLRGYIRLSINGRDPTGGYAEVARDENAILFEARSNPQFAALRDAVQAKIDEIYAQRDAPAATAPSAADEIEKFAALHAKGILTDEEFAAKKKQILGL